MTDRDIVTHKCNLDWLFTVLYILDTCRLQFTKVTKGALNASQSEEARDSICLAGPEHLHRGSFYSKFLHRALTLLKDTPGRPEMLYSY